jgi:IclR family acetate operon transcriptional repressor
LLDGFTEATIVDSEKLLEQLRAVQLQGYAVDLEEYAHGLCCVAAPVRDANGRAIAALSLSGPSIRLGEERLHGEAAEAIKTAAARLSRELGSPL